MIDLVTELLIDIKTLVSNLIGESVNDLTTGAEWRSGLHV